MTRFLTGLLLGLACGVLAERYNRPVVRVVTVAAPIESLLVHVHGRRKM